MIKDYPKINQKEYDNLRAFAFRTAKNTLEYYNASDYSWISDEDIQNDFDIMEE